MKMEPPAMHDDFLRHVRPAPRAAFVHELKARLDRQPRARPIVGRPSFLRTLIVALLIGGAAFAVTMMSTRREAGVERATASASLSQPGAAAVTGVAPALSPSQPQDEITPFTPRNIRRDIPMLPAFEEARDEPPEVGPRTSARPVGAPPPSTQSVSGFAFGAAAGPRSIAGAGATFPYPAFAAWGNDYMRLTGVSVLYQSIGSGGGVKYLQTRQVTFAASDVPWGAEDLKVTGFFQFPVIVSAVVPVVHLPGIGASRITLDGATLASIYLGGITRWNDGQIRKLNPGLALPDMPIILLYRSDGASATYLFTEYLSKSSSSYHAQLTIDVASGTAARGDDGMAALVERIPGAIGYLDYNYARQKSIASVRLINRAGAIVPAAPESLQSAVAHGAWAGAAGFAASLANMPGQQSWPIVGASYVIVRSNGDPTATGAALQFFDWAYRDGSKTAAQLGYVTMPASVADLVRAAWRESVKGAPRNTNRE